MSVFFAAPIDQYPDYNKVTNLPVCVTADSAFPASNLLTYDPTQVMRSTTNTPVITWDFGVARTFDVVSLLYTNIQDIGTLIIEGSLNNTAWTTLYNGLALAHLVAGQTTQNKMNMLKNNLTLLNLSSPVSYRYLRISLNTLGAGTLPTIGRLFVGTKYKPKYGWQYGSQFTFTDLSKRDRTDRGALVVDPIPTVLGANVKLDFMSKDEMYDYIFDFNYWRGSARGILACLDVEDTKRLQKNTLYCTISDGRTISFDSYNTHSVAWVLESIGVG